MAEINEQRSTTNGFMTWGIGLVYIIAAVAIGATIFFVWQGNVKSESNQLNNVQSNLQNQIPTNIAL